LLATRPVDSVSAPSYGSSGCGLACSGRRYTAATQHSGHLEVVMGEVRVRQEFAGLRFTPGSLDRRTNALLAYACALMAG